jgi:hypothetical protein
MKGGYLERGRWCLLDVVVATIPSVFFGRRSGSPDVGVVHSGTELLRKGEYKKALRASETKKEWHS